MFYSIVGKNWSAGVVTRDGVVVQATENFQWACGEAIREVVTWVGQRGMTWSVSAVVPRDLPLFNARKGVRHAEVPPGRDALPPKRLS
jgi:hypothetical protein